MLNLWTSFGWQGPSREWRLEQCFSNPFSATELFPLNRKCRQSLICKKDKNREAVLLVGTRAGTGDWRPFTHCSLLPRRLGDQLCEFAWDFPRFRMRVWCPRKPLHPGQILSGAWDDSQNAVLLGRMMRINETSRHLWVPCSVWELVHKEHLMASEKSACLDLSIHMRVGKRKGRQSGALSLYLEPAHFFLFLFLIILKI